MKGKRNDWALGNVQNQVPALVFKPESSENKKNWGKNMTENEQKKANDLLSAIKELREDMERSNRNLDSLRQEVEEADKRTKACLRWLDSRNLLSQRFRRKFADFLNKDEENEQIGGRVIEGRDSVYSFISLSVVKYGGKKGVELTLEIPFTKQRLGKLLSVDDARKLSVRLKELADFAEVCDA